MSAAFMNRSKNQLHFQIKHISQLKDIYIRFNKEKNSSADWTKPCNQFQLFYQWYLNLSKKKKSQNHNCSVDSRNFKKWGRSPITAQNVGERLKILGDDFMIKF